jgi:RNA polymerase sigma-70 factor, ECF subfamily
MATAEAKDHHQQQAFRALFEAELQYVWNTLRYLGVHEADVHDVAHDVFITVFQRFEECDPSEPLRPWLFVIAYHAASNYRRLARHRREVHTDGVEPADEARGVEEAIDERRRAALLVRALDGIGMEKRAVLVMHDMDGVAVPKIAEVLSIPLNTAYSRLRLARNELAERVRALTEPGERA